MKWLVLVGLVVVVDSAAVYQRRADIPVKVVYDKPAQINYLRNLQARTQLSSDETQHEEARLIEGSKNLEARSQLSADELSEIGKHIDNVVPQTKIVTPDQPQYPQVELFNKIQEFTRPPQENIDDIYDRIQEIILSGAKKIKIAADDGKFGDRKAEILSRVNTTLETFLLSTKKMMEVKGISDLKQEQNFIQSMISNFQNITGGFISTFTNPPGTQSDEQPPNPIQGIFNQIQNGLQQFVGTFSGQPTQATVLGDSPSTPAGPVQFVQNAVSQFQQNVNNLFQPSTGAPGSQGDDVTTPTGPIQFIQNAIQQIGQNIPNPFQPTTKSPSAQGDAPTTQGGPAAFIQNAGQQVAQVFNNLNPFNQQTTQKPASQADPTTPPNPLQVIQGAGQTVIDNINNANPLAQGGSNPIQGIIEQVSQSNPFSQGGGGNPIQGFVDQAGQAFNQSAGNIPLVGQISQVVNQGGNPLEAGQAIASQVGEAVQGANPAQLVGQLGQGFGLGSQKDSNAVTQKNEEKSEVPKVPTKEEDKAEVPKLPTTEEEKPSANIIEAEIEKLEENPPKKD